MDSFNPGKSPGIGSLDRVTGLAASAAEVGSVQLVWNPLTGARSFTIEFTTDLAGPWNELGFSTSSSFLARDLESGIRHYFRVAGVGTAGRGPFSDEANQIVT